MGSSFVIFRMSLLSILLGTNVALQQQPSWTTKKTSSHPLIVERMTAQEYQRRRQEPGGPFALDRPILITNAMSVSECEDLCEQWIQTVGSQTITVQRRKTAESSERKTTTMTQLYDCTVAQSLDLMMQSTPRDSIFAFVEGLLDSKQLSLQKSIDVEHQQQFQKTKEVLDSIQLRLVQAREALFCDGDDHENWFDFFPDFAKPSDCVIMAGEGATSTLHRDPFEWTGTSLCLEGRKIWRFLSGKNVDDWDKRLQSYRLESIAWDDSKGNDNHGDITNQRRVTLSAGWQSDLSLYRRDDSSTTNLYSARALANLDESQAEAYLESLASDMDVLQPHPNIQLPLPTIGIDCCSVVQHPGELLLIPPYWYHQTYAPEPSLAVASQRCGSLVDAPRVLGHILTLQQFPLSSDRNAKNGNNNGEQQRISVPKILQDFVDGSVHPKDVDVQSTIALLFDYLQTVKQQ